ncbi:GNAT family N-acetyltransferase [Spirosoma sp. HMF4905]|uniref:GNAT family N-acetyltransferase n=1 Tax=Spirosoma arboris TaxID=2682092 RepID=A0A7K1SF09_9BACT|nr:GNAT family N-acetyltransferase [Spirosoma arboris]MVM32323.1 GNAT family N-acetyltransferase [Spirosoma arboris]
MTGILAYNWRMDEQIETSRLVLRDYRPTDLESIHAYVSQPVVVQYAPWGPNSLEDTQEFLEEVQERKAQKPRLIYEFAIERKEDGRQIGGCELVIDKQIPLEAILGYIINPDYWGQGYATEVTHKLVELAIHTFNAKTIKATCDERNKGSIRVLEKSGFVQDKVIENDFLQKGEMRTTLVFRYANRE